MKKKRIESITLKKIGVFKDLTIEFPTVSAKSKAEVHLFVGVNGSGKTTLLEMLAGFFGGNEEVLEKKLANDSSLSTVFDGVPYETFFLKTYNQKILTSNPLDSSNPSANLQEPSVNYATPRDSFNRLSSYNNKKENPSTPLDFAVFSYAGNRNIRSEGVVTAVVPETFPLYQALDFNKDTYVDNQNNQLFQWIANIIMKDALAYRKGEKLVANNYKKTLSKIESILSELLEIDIAFEIETNGPLQVIWVQDSQPINVNLLSDGIKSLLTWLVDLLLRLHEIKWLHETPILERNFILFLDEIAVHLHPALQRKILPLVQDLFPNAQIFLTTHSPFVVGSVSDAWVHVLKEKDGITTVKKTIPSMAGSSINAVLKEIFDVEERFDEGTEVLINEFYAFRQELLLGRSINQERFKELISILSRKGEEVNNIIQRELRQLQRRGQL